MSKEWGHDALADDLAAHRRSNTSRLVWTNIPMGPAGSVRPDVYELPISFVRFSPLTFEVKVSESDFRSDITSGKWQAYLNFSAAVVFAVPASLRVSKADMPKGCGLIVRHESGWRMAKGPTFNRVDDLGREVWMKLLIKGMTRPASEDRVAYVSAWHMARKARSELGRRAAKIITEIDTADQRVIDAQKRAEEFERKARERTDKAVADRRETLAELDARIEEMRVAACESLGLPPSTSLDALRWRRHENLADGLGVIREAQATLNTAISNLNRLYPRQV